MPLNATIAVAPKAPIPTAAAAAPAAIGTRAGPSSKALSSKGLNPALFACSCFLPMSSADRPTSFSAALSASSFAAMASAVAPADTSLPTKINVRERSATTAPLPFRLLGCRYPLVDDVHRRHVVRDREPRLIPRHHVERLGDG